MNPTKEHCARLKSEMERNAILLKENFQANIGEVLRASFRNRLLRFVIINNASYPSNSKVFIGLNGLVRLKYHNPHIEDLRIDYHEERQKLFLEVSCDTRHVFIHRFYRNFFFAPSAHGKIFLSPPSARPFFNRPV